MAPHLSTLGNDSLRPTHLAYNAGLDGLRGMGVIAILFYHSGVNWLPGGFLSVSTFFTLSGFLITSLLLYEFTNTGRIDLWRFWARRFRRLIPGALVALVVIALLGATVGDASQVARLRWDGLAALFYVSNWRFILLGNDYADIFASPSLVQHFWSLSIEEQFYLTFPLAAILCLRIGGRIGFALIVGLLAVLSTVWMMYLFEPDVPTSRLYFGTDTRAAEILLGAILAIWHAGRLPLQGAARGAAVALGGLGLLGNFIFWFAVPMETAWLWQGGFSLYAIVNAAIIIGVMQTSGPARAVLSCAPLPWLGRISYGLYIYHFAVYVTLTESLSDLAPWPLFIARVAVTFGLAVPSFYLLEQPVRQRRLITGWQPWIFMPAGFASVAIMLVVATVDPPQPAVDLAELADQQRSVATAEGPRIMIAGDSVAYVIGKGMLRWARRTEKASVFNVARPGCGIARGGRLMTADKRRADECDNWPEVWTNELARAEPDVVVVIAGAWDYINREFADWGEPLAVGDQAYDTWLLSEYEAAIELLSSTGARVIWLTSPCRKPFFGGAGTWDPKLARALNVVLRRLDRKLGDKVEILDLYGKVCPDHIFVNTMEGMRDFRPDGNHFSREGEDWIADWLASYILAGD